ncbi:MAG: flagellar motor switch protein FliN [Rhizobiales bacterium]|nr:flagellar motor switch protein FliN [Hyphomicrobiales bacterium]
MSQAAAETDQASEQQLNRAIEELRGVLGDKEKPGKAAPAAAAPAAAGARPAASQPAAAATVPPFVASASGPSGIIMGIPVDVQVVLGRAEMAVADLMALQKGSTVPLDRRIGEPIDVVVNGRRIARGEIIVMEDDPSRFGVRLTEIMSGGRDE